MTIIAMYHTFYAVDLQGQTPPIVTLLHVYVKTVTYNTIFAVSAYKDTLIRPSLYCFLSGAFGIFAFVPSVVHIISHGDRNVKRGCFMHIVQNS